MAYSFASFLIWRENVGWIESLSKFREYRFFNPTIRCIVVLQLQHTIHGIVIDAPSIIKINERCTHRICRDLADGNVFR